ncbi:MAG TPA: hypothetical protein VFZ52_18770 [Chryseolinea sp.]
MKILNYFNLRTLLALIVSQVATFIAIKYNIKFHADLLLFGLFVVFPLHFSLQAAFKRREKALEYFSLFKAGSTALHYTFQMSEDMAQEKKEAIRQLLNSMGTNLINQLESQVPGYNQMQQKLNEVFAFMQLNAEEIPKRNAQRMVRYIKDISESSAYLVSLVSHRTMLGLRFYSTFFIIILPLAQAPLILYRFETIVPAWGIHLSLAFTTLALVTLNNFQTLIEYPFDPKGIDNVKVREFSLNL